MLAHEVESTGSSALAARNAASASILVCSGSRSRKMPESVMTTSIARTAQLGRAGPARRRRDGHSCRNAARAPISASTCPIGAPSFFRLSVPHSTKATVSGSGMPPSGGRATAGPAARRPAPQRRWEYGRDRNHADCGPSAGLPACAADRRRAPAARNRRRAHAACRRFRCLRQSRLSRRAARFSARRGLAARRAVRRRRRPATSASTAASPRSRRGAHSAIASRNRPALRPRRLADDMQAVRDQRVFELQKCGRARRSRLGRTAPRGLGEARSSPPPEPGSAPQVPRAAVSVRPARASARWMPSDRSDPRRVPRSRSAASGS